MSAFMASAKRDVTVTVKMTEEDLKLLHRAGETIWPGAPITRSTLVVAMARLGAESVLEKQRKKRGGT